MAKKVQSQDFLLEIALMRDTLGILHNLSLYRQKRDASIVTANENTRTALRMLNALKLCMSLTEATAQCVISFVDSTLSK